MQKLKENFLRFDNDFLTKIIVRYALDPCFKNLVNLENLMFKDDIWWHGEAIVVPKVDSLYRDLLIGCHNAIYNGHMAITETLKQVETNFLRPKLKNDVKNYVNICNVCQCSKASTTRMADLLQSLEILE